VFRPHSSEPNVEQAGDEADMVGLRLPLDCLL